MSQGKVFKKCQHRSKTTIIDGEKFKVGTRDSKKTTIEFKNRFEDGEDE